MAAVAPLGDEYMKTSVLSLAKKRVIWLFVLMFSATFTGLIIGSYEDLMQHLPVVAMFIPMLMDTGGNAGGQTSTLVIRGLALGEIEIHDYWQVLRKEIGVALIAGGALGVFDFLWILVQNELGLISIGSSANPPYLIAGMVAITLFVTVFLAKTVGATLPIVAKRLQLDPALMAGPLMTTIVDALSLMLYFFIATQIFHLV
jgi:magnesium transporter